MGAGASCASESDWRAEKTGQLSVEQLEAAERHYEVLLATPVADRPEVLDLLMTSYVEGLKAGAVNLGAAADGEVAPPATLLRQASGSITNQAHRHYLVATDGSANGDLAFQVGVDLVKGKDKLSVMHVFDSTKKAEDLPSKYKPDALKERYEVELVGRLPAARWGLLWADKAGEPTKDFLVREVNRMAARGSRFQSRAVPEFIIMGYRGRKHTDMSKLGSSCETALREVHMPTVVVKYPPVEPRTPRTFVAAVKGPTTTLPYEVALSMVKPSDTLKVLWIYDEDGSIDATIAKMRETYEQDIQSRGLINASLDMVRHEPGRAVPSMINDFCAEHNASYLVLAPTIDAVDLTSTSYHVLKDINCNVVLAKK